MTDCASLLLRALRVLILSRSENRSAIRESRSCVVGGLSIKCFHIGISVDLRNLSAEVNLTQGQNIQVARISQSMWTLVSFLVYIHTTRGGGTSAARGRGVGAGRGGGVRAASAARSGRREEGG